ncbi:MAG: histidine kinase [Cyclobacteriaceae bacterium]|nr:histidine kinase [Cyclobacteriaceae bacterium]
MSKTKIYWILQIGGWALFAIVNIVLNYLQDTLNVQIFFYSLLISIWYIISTHIFRYFIIRKDWLNAKIKKVIFKIFIFIFALTISNFLVHLLIWLSLGVLDFEYDLDPVNVGVYLLSTLLIYFVWALFYFIYHYFDRYNTALKYEALKNEIELNNLKSQLNPHFIFNALNSIRALIDENPSKSKDAITQLSSILRSSLVINKKKLTGFNEEMHTVRDYLDLETIRFEERLRTNFNIDPKSKNFTVPPLMIQTLVENGIKHGISKLKEGGEISLETQVKDSRLYIKIRNNGQLTDKKFNGTKGLGIENTRQRLKLLYGNKATFSIFNEDENTVLSEVSLPQKI